MPTKPLWAEAKSNKSANVAIISPKLFDLNLLSDSAQYVLAALFRVPGGSTLPMLAKLTALTPAQLQIALTELDSYLLVKRYSKVAMINNIAAKTEFLTASDEAWTYTNLFQLVNSCSFHDPYPSDNKLPTSFYYLFWNDDAAKLNINDNGYYIAVHLLENAGWDEMVWALNHVPYSELSKILKSERIDPKIKNLVRNWLQTS